MNQERERWSTRSVIKCNFIVYLESLNSRQYRCVRKIIRMLKIRNLSPFFRETLTRNFLRFLCIPGRGSKSRFIWAHISLSIPSEFTISETIPNNFSKTHTILRTVLFQFMIPKKCMGKSFKIYTVLKNCTRTIFEVILLPRGENQNFIRSCYTKGIFCIFARRSFEGALNDGWNTSCSCESNPHSHGRRL